MRYNYLTQLLLLALAFSSYSILAQSKYVLTPHTMPGPVFYMYLTPEKTVNCTDDATILKRAIDVYNETIRVSDGNGISSVAPPINLPAGISSATFAVTYTGFTAQAQAAFQRAVDIWAGLITSSQTIRINANFSDLGTNGSGSLILGSAGPNNLRGLTGGGITSWYPDPLADKLLGSDAGPGLSDINASFTSNAGANFYFGVDGVPQVGKTDFVSVVLHEIGHGLGFLGSGRVNSNSAPCTNVTGEGCWGYVSGSTIPVIYDRSVVNGSNVSIMNTATNANPSTGLFSFITTNNLFFAGTTVKAANSNTAAKLYAPTTYTSGSTYSHFDETTYGPASGNALMTPGIATNEVQQLPGKLGCALLKDIGWTLSGTCDAILAIDLADFSAKNEGKTNVIKWITGSEKDNQLFKIQRSTDGKNFTVIGQLKGAGTTQTPQYYTLIDESPHQSINYYRLQYVESDGTSYFSKTIAINNLGKDAIWVQPTLVQNKLNLVTSELKENDVPFSVFDLMGRAVKRGIFPNNQTALQLDISELPIGQYFIQFQGHSTQRFIKQ